ncbi:predicted protein [Phaeodactylum tricornutum CCAP 1055/1]|jgi:phosphatidylinositol glycan class B|uniref:Mannosyltransferase n=1 Tax=Phaeodactylum tricornutum (strain CCAP 1055/1) TaxID=556484 RepID=B7FVN3_PHATC|nr:predicted protein [Phaeodactylum tricornutum CCAP 1055/1]EEC49434.1 predicted protein [Phaeodactylum tricornutum CCAP 1055/1]|eukprot:XP_002178736.1 predicted protein [Phaeodactylum tricornutum CCAP 1055/1]
MPIWNWKTFILLCAFRIANTFLVNSYFDPDEFWQIMEPAYCRVYNVKSLCPGLTWEWKRRAPESAINFLDRSMQGPARAYLSVLPTYIYFFILKASGMDSYWLISRGPMVLFAVTVAAPIDMAVYYAAGWLEPIKGSNQSGVAAWCLFCSLCSWFNGYTLVRTFANNQEAESVILAIALVAPELIGNRSARYALLRSCMAFLIGGFGVGIRFTSIAAFIPMGVLLALRHLTLLKRVCYLLVPCAFFGLAGLSFGMLVDRYFFGFWTLPFLGNFHFNVVLDYASLYGSHPMHWYFTIGVPALAGLLLPFLCFDFWELTNGRSSYGKQNLWIIVLSYVGIMSFNDHKEFRYILPVLPLFCLLVGSHVQALLSGSTWRARFLRLTFVGANLITLVYLGMFHQSGPILVNQKIVELVRKSQETTDVSIHYLTGACHSTPLHSSLHVPPFQFRTWSLDCSPDCRAGLNRVCETEEFVDNPAAFVDKAYFPCLNDENLCTANATRNGTPDFVVTFSSFVRDISAPLHLLGLQEVARFPDHINGARFGNWTLGSDFLAPNYRHFMIAGGMEISLEEMVLFARPCYIDDAIKCE